MRSSQLQGGGLGGGSKPNPSERTDMLQISVEDGRGCVPAQDRMEVTKWWSSPGEITPGRVESGPGRRLCLDPSSSS